jgi:hypothetical protein
MCNDSRHKTGVVEVRTGLLSVASVGLLAACNDPLAGVERISDVALADDQPRREAVASPEELARQDGVLGLVGTPTERAEAPQPAAEKPGQRSFLARLLSPAGDAVRESPRGTRLASRGRDRIVTSTRAQPSASGASLGRGRAALRPIRPAETAQDIPYGTILPFAKVGRVCEARHRAKGRRVETSDSGYVLYDTAPRSTGPRTFYVTGFADRCPRQFTAALAMFGAPSMHEQLRYGLPSKEYPYSDTDRAYEKVKSAICGVSRRKPCGNRIGALERNTVFISTYERFSHNARWADILVHDGAVLAASLKDP